ncbi:hydrolase [Bacillus sp. HMF5848]|uniref:hydrolase n=1 Tax=Bacillus sp. HMF5848 TaxID=2495421 RepID=UPI000F797AC6|nr:hydrolase [Bacillus sp. HMF5848]RSK29414.1 hydrolase [Bacillus sp. HMF5848]
MRKREKVTTLGQKTYYIHVASGEITQSRTASAWDFEISALDDEITLLRELFDQNYSSDIQSFYRAHVPYVQYHDDKPNDGYDNGLLNIYKKIYELGTDETKKQIEEMDIITTLEVPIDER